MNIDPLANIIGSIRFPMTSIQWVGPEETKILTIQPLDEGDDLQFWQLPQPGETNRVVDKVRRLCFWFFWNVISYRHLQFHTQFKPSQIILPKKP